MVHLIPLFATLLTHFILLNCDTLRDTQSKVRKIFFSGDTQDKGGHTHDLEDQPEPYKNSSSNDSLNFENQKNQIFENRI